MYMHQTYLLMELWEYLKIVMLLLPYNKTFAYDEHYGWLCEPINLSGKHKGVVDKKKKKHKGVSRSIVELCIAGSTVS